MRGSGKWVLVGCLLAALCSAADYKVDVTFSNGAKRSLDKLVVEDGSIVLKKENLKVPFAQVGHAEFFMEEMMDLQACELLMKQAAFGSLVEQVDQFLEPIGSGIKLKSNLDIYQLYKMRALYWLGQYDNAKEVAMNLGSKKSEYAGETEAYLVLISLEQGETMETVAAAASRLPNRFSAVKEFIRGRLALNARAHETALQHFSNILVYNERDMEWVAAATFYEGMVYKKTGYLDQVKHVMNELKIAWPDGVWASRADELKVD